MCIRDSPQGDLTTCLGWQNQDSLPTTLATVMEKVIRDEPVTTDEGITFLFQSYLFSEPGMIVLCKKFTRISYIDTTLF